MVDPVQPMVDPAQPVVGPAQPVVDPAQPAVDPAQPAVDPAQPAVDPAQPAVDPVQPVVNPAWYILPGWLLNPNFYKTQNMTILSKPLLRRRHKKCFWNSRDISTNFRNCKLFAHYFRLNLVGLSLRILRIEIQLRMRATFDAWIRPESVKKFQMVNILKNGKSLLLFFPKFRQETCFTSYTLNLLWEYFVNATHIVKSCDCHFILKRYFSEYELIETYIAINLQCVTSIGPLKTLGFL